MDITGIQITLKQDGRLCAFANVVFDDCFVVRGLKIIKGEGRHFVAMPSWRRNEGSHQDIAHPITPQMRDRLEQAVLAEYRDRLLKVRGELTPE